MTRRRPTPAVQDTVQEIADKSLFPGADYTLEDLFEDRRTVAEVLGQAPALAQATLRALVQTVQVAVREYALGRITYEDLEQDVQALADYVLPHLADAVDV